jgi:hypothetical protein
MSLNQAIRYYRYVGTLVQNMATNLCSDGCPFPVHSDIAIITPVNQHYQPVGPVTAARQIVGILENTQTADRESGHKREPLGELIKANVQLIGFEGQPVFLRWSISQMRSRTHAHLFSRWLRSDIVGYRLVATTENDTGAVNMWIPLPKVPGPYILHLDLTAEGSDLISTNSPPFG